MKTTLILAGALAVAGCTVQVPAETATTTPAYTPAPSGLDLDEASFVATVVSEYPEIGAAQTDQEIIDFGRSMCAAIDNGSMTLTGLTTFAMDQGLDPSIVGYLIGASIGAFCPWNSDFFG